MLTYHKTRVRELLVSRAVNLVTNAAQTLVRHRRATEVQRIRELPVHRIVPALCLEFAKLRSFVEQRLSELREQDGASSRCITTRVLPSPCLELERPNPRMCGAGVCVSYRNGESRYHKRARPRQWSVRARVRVAVLHSRHI